MTKNQSLLTLSAILSICTLGLMSRAIPANKTGPTFKHVQRPHAYDPPSVAQDGKDRKNILIINSYHHGYKWSDNLSRAIIQQLENYKVDSNIYFEYMDTKKTFLENEFSNLFQKYKSRYKNQKIDLIFSLDDNALTFLIKHKKSLWQKVPVIFGGIDVRKFENLPNQKAGYTGLMESASNLRILTKILAIDGQIETIFPVTSSGPNDHYLESELTELKKNHPNLEINRSLLVHQNIFDVVNAINALQRDPKSAIFLDINFISKEKKTQILGYHPQFNPKVKVYYTHQASHHPKYEATVGITGNSQAKIMIEMARSIWQGTPIESIPIIQDTPIEVTH